MAPKTPPGLHPWTWRHPQWPHFEIASEALRSDARVLDTHINFLVQSVGWMGQQGQQTLSIEALCQEGVATSKIEGEIIHPDAVRSSIVKKLGLPTAGWAQPSREVEGLVAVLLDATEQWVQPLTKERLHGWHSALFPTGRSGVEKIQVGQFRTEAINIISGGPMGKPETIHYRAVPAERVEVEMERFLTWFNAWNGTDGLERAAIAHAWFEAIHPFEDGNGRVGRAIIDLALAQNEQSSCRLFSISRQLSQQRKAYVDSLELLNRPDPTKSITVDAWFGVFLKAVSQAVASSQLVVDMAIKKNQFWATWSHVNLNDRQRKVLNKLLDSGPDGHEGGVNNSKYASMGQTSRATATRDLSELAQAGILSPSEKGGRSRSYHLDWEALIVQPAANAKRRHQP